MWDCDADQLQQHEAVVLQGVGWHTLVRTSQFESTRMQLRALHDTRCPLASAASLPREETGDTIGGADAADSSPLDWPSPALLTQRPREPRVAACSPTALGRRLQRSPEAGAAAVIAGFGRRRRSVSSSAADARSGSALVAHGLHDSARTPASSDVAPSRLATACCALQDACASEAHDQGAALQAAALSAPLRLAKAN